MRGGGEGPRCNRTSGRRASGAQAPGGAGATPRDVAEALRRARAHGRAAARESIAALQSLLDAASLAATGVPAGERPELALMARALGQLADGLGRPEAASSRLLDAVAEALDAEIARWEARALDDPEARAVLRAWLGMRELLWEVGVRRTRARPARATSRARRPERAPDTRAEPGTAERTARTGPRTLQRVPLEG
jgi:hypothetical protein